MTKIQAEWYDMYKKDIERNLTLGDLDLKDIDNLDSLTKMLKGAFAIDAYKHMIEIADKLYTQAYKALQVLNDKSVPHLHIFERNIVYYIGFSQLSKGIALQKTNKLEESKKCIEKYNNLDLVNGVEQEEQQTIDYFKVLARANTYTIDLLQGKEEVMEEYANFIKEGKNDELLPGLITILESAIMHNFNISHILTELGEKIDKSIDAKETRENKRYYVDYLYLLSLYKFKEGDHKTAINIILDILVTSDRVKDDTGFKKICVLFENFRLHASQSQLQDYSSILRQILKGDFENEKSIQGIMFDGSRIVSICP